MRRIGIAAGDIDGLSPSPASSIAKQPKDATTDCRPGVKVTQLTQAHRTTIAGNQHGAEALCAPRTLPARRVNNWDCASQ